jgi:hypothetical protein
MPEPHTSQAVRVRDDVHGPQTYSSLHDAMVALLTRYPEAVLSDLDFETEPVIWVWPSNTASMHATPDDAVACIAPEAHAHAV